MPRLVVKSNMGRLMSRLPHKLFISGQFVGVMQQPTVVLMMPPGVYLVTIQSMVPMLSASTTIQLRADGDCRLSFKDRERGWDVLFVIDMVLWIVKRFLHLAAPWTWIYEVVTNGFFVLWLIYEWSIRKKYFKLTVESLPA